MNYKNVPIPYKGTKLLIIKDRVVGAQGFEPWTA